ncbi:MAG: HAD family phosphatase [Chloroflexi bacterium]|nr:HAD family phosphatase [Chloroflexota bacterium]MCA2001910.1 HAD family phosphatase [Chloroflexota bacterium]
MAICAVFFDFGGVLMRTEFQAPRQKLAERFNMDYEDMERLVFNSESARRAALGEITEEEHWANVLKRFHLPAAESKPFRDQFFGGDVVDRDLVEYIRSLRGSVHTGLISNAWNGLRGFLAKEKLLDLFDTVVISAEVGAVKPSERIYRLALEQAKVGASEAIFVDDFPENITGCQKVGMMGILFDHPEKSLDRLHRVLKLK